MLDWLYRALGAMLAFFSGITGSYAIALVFYALIFKIVFLPFSIKQQKNQVKMAKLTPQIELIRAKYKGRTDRASMQKQQQEIMEFQQKEGYSPLSGCLPLLIQLPIIMLLYAVIQNPLSYTARTIDVVDYYNDHYEDDSFNLADLENHEYGDFFIQAYGDAVTNDDGSYRELTRDDIISALKNRYKDEVTSDTEIALIDAVLKDVKDGMDEKGIEKYGFTYDSLSAFELFGVNLAKTPSFNDFDLLVLIPVLAAVSSWLSMFLMRKMNNTGLQTAQDAQTQASMRIMDLVMPLMTLFIAFNFSAMLGLYWMLQSLIGILQSFILSRTMPLPKYTEEELREMKRKQKEVEKAQRQAAKLQPKHKSLHYIDEDDYDELPTVAPSQPQNNDKNRIGGNDIPEIKD